MEGQGLTPILSCQLLLYSLCTGVIMQKGLCKKLSFQFFGKVIKVFSDLDGELRSRHSSWK